MIGKLNISPFRARKMIWKEIGKCWFPKTKEFPTKLNIFRNKFRIILSDIVIWRIYCTIFLNCKLKKQIYRMKMQICRIKSINCWTTHILLKVLKNVSRNWKLKLCCWLMKSNVYMPPSVNSTKKLMLKEVGPII